MDNNTWAEGFKRGQESVKRKNDSGCCCKINENEDSIESPCQLHMEWRDEAVKQYDETFSILCQILESLNDYKITWLSNLLR